MPAQPLPCSLRQKKSPEAAKKLPVPLQNRHCAVGKSLLPTTLDYSKDQQPSHAGANARQGQQSVSPSNETCQIKQAALGPDQLRKSDGAGPKHADHVRG